MAGKKKSNANQEVLHTLKIGQVVGTIERRLSNSGFSYDQFTLNRVWLTRSSGKESTGASFFEQHEEDIVAVVRAACAYIRGGSNGSGKRPSEGSEEALVGNAQRDHSVTRKVATDA